MTRIFSKTEKISVFKHIRMRVDEDIFLTFYGRLRIDMKVFASRALLQTDKSCHLFFTITDAACLSVCIPMNTGPNLLHVIL